MLDHRAWDKQVDALAREFTVIRYDVSGHGQSTASEKPWKTYEQLHELLKYLGVGHAALIGHSMGARIAIDAAIAYPELVDELILVGPGMSGFPFTGRDWHQNAGTERAVRRAGDSGRAVDYFMRSWVAGPHRTPSQVDPEVWSKVREMASGATGWGPASELDPPAVGRLGEIHAPTLVIEGELDCEDIHHIGRWVEREVAGSRRVVMPGVAHLPSMESPEKFNQLVLEFLRAPHVAQTAQGAAPIQETFVDVPGGRLWADRRGEGEAVLLVHDGILHSVIWDDLAPALATQYSVIRFDRRGYGRSEQATTRYSDIEDISAVLAHFKVDKVNLVGSSAGSALCIDYALAHPEQVISLTLIGPVVDGMAVTPHLTNRGGRLTAAMWRDATVFRTYWTTTDPFYLAPESTAARERVAAILEKFPQNLDFSGQALLDSPPPALPRLGQIRVPTLIVVGEFDIPDVHAHAGALQVGVPHARRIVIPHSGHAVPVERPDALDTEVLTHLQNRAFLTVLDNEGADAAAELLRKARAANPGAVLVAEQELNRRGYNLLQRQQLDDAIAVFRLAVLAFPASVNTHDSLGEALLQRGDREGALESYRKALEIDPASPSAKAAVTKIEGEKR